MTKQELILNFVNQYNRPFGVDTVVSLTGVEIATVEDYLPELIAIGKLKQIEEAPAIYIRNNRYSSRVGYQHYKGWTFDLKAAHQLLDILEQGKYKSIREIAQVIGKSRQWVYIYLEALASIEVVDLRHHVYVVISRKNVPKLGRKVTKGILRQLRALNKISAYRVIR
jgi:DNA-binding IclR family transcriptional regulator